MAFTKTIVLLAAATMAYAAPQTGSSVMTSEADVSAQSNGATCGNGQKLACCNTDDSLLGLNCLSVPVLAVPVQQACGSNVAACCQSGSSDGNLINLELNCLSVPL